MEIISKQDAPVLTENNTLQALQKFRDNFRPNTDEYNRIDAMIEVWIGVSTTIRVPVWKQLIEKVPTFQPNV